MSVKSVIASGVHTIAGLSGYSLRRARAMKAARIIMFHGVGDDEYPAAEFEKHLLCLKENFSIVSLAALKKMIAGKEPLTNEIVLTFDDGLRNNLTCAYPILKRLNLPATFFICPGLVEGQRWLWNHEARARLKSLPPAARQSLCAQVGAQCDCGTEQIIGWMKTLPLSTRHEVEDAIRCATPQFRPTDTERMRYDIMNWPELQSLDPNLITIGAHTVNHPILSTLAPKDLQFEIAESRRQLESKLGRTVDQFCYPNGAHNPSVVLEARKNYEVAVTTEAGFVHGAEDLLELPRIGIVPEPLLSWRLHRPTA